MTHEHPPASTPRDDQVYPSTFKPAVEFRWCYYLHLNTALEDAAKRRQDKDGIHCFFTVEGKRRLVFVRGYFNDEPYYGAGNKWCLIYQTTTKDRNKKGQNKPNIKPIGSVLPGDSRKAFVQTIPERYPLRLIDSEALGNLDHMTKEAIRKIVDGASYRGG